MNGVVHVGAHTGQEVPLYLAAGRAPIICFEPQLLEWDHPSNVKLFRTALSDHSGTLNMRIPHHLHTNLYRDTQSASGLPLIHQRARDIGWTPTPFDVTEVPMIRFDEWAKEHEFQNGSCSYLVIDVQGMELQVLMGFGKCLSGFQEMKIECSQPAVYEGGASAQEIIGFLAQNGFLQTSPTVAHGDIFFSKGVIVE
jgi:FkbM family methyltransferase